MQITLKHGLINDQQCECLIIGAFESKTLIPETVKLDEISNGYISSILNRGDLDGKVGSYLLLDNVPNITAERILIVGCGKEDKLNERQYKKIITAAINTAKSTAASNATLFLHTLNIPNRNDYWKIRFAVETIQQNEYKYLRFKKEPAKDTSKLETIAFQLDNIDSLEIAETAVKHANAVSNGITAAKNIANLPPNYCNPKYLADQAIELGSSSYINVNIIDEDEMNQLGMHSYLAVSSGSINPAYMSVIHYHNHPNENAQPIVLVGKGVTFDSGGISLKPAQDMDEMKFDMCGAASVYGTIKAIAELELPINVIGIMAGCENLIGGKSYRPGDVLTSMSGLNIEVLNTDAEGRLILCDALTYVERFNPELVIDIATLTGACVVALGNHNSGLFSQDEELVNGLSNAAKQADDPAWHMPLNEEYNELIESKIADIANAGVRAGGAITAACFLSNFTQNYRWAHLDIAGTAWKSGKEKGATGRPVSLLTQFLINIAAKK